MLRKLSFPEMNWRYALGEVILIIIGVTIALAATAWYEDTKLRRDELAALEQLHESLSDDLGHVRTQGEFLRRVGADLDSLIRWHAGGDYAPENLPGLFGSLASWRSVTIKTAPFESLKSANFELVSNGALRMELIEFYEDTYPTLKRNSEIDRDFIRYRVWPSLFPNFDQSGGVDANEWTPINPEAVRENPAIVNLSKWRIRSLRSFLFRDYEIADAQIQGILGMIEAELQK